MKNELQTYVSHIENYLDGCFDFYEFEPQGVLFDSMRYSLLAGGKRLRPIFVLDFCRMCGGDWKKAAYYYGNCYSIEAALSEAEHFKSLLTGKNITTVYYDVEGNMLNQDKVNLTNIILAFCNTLKAAGYNCGIYSSSNSSAAYFGRILTRLRSYALQISS